MAALADLQVKLFSASDMVARLALDASGGEPDGHDDMAMAATTDAPVMLGEPTSVEPSESSHVHLTDHPEMAEALDELSAAVTGLEVLIGADDQPGLVRLKAAHAAYEESVLDLHAIEDADHVMASYHSDVQIHESLAREEVHQLQLAKAGHLQESVERSRIADKWLRGLLPVLVFTAAGLLAYLIRSEVRRRSAEVAALRAANRDKDEFLASVSHELRTPLTGVRGYLELLHGAATDFSADDHEEMIAIAAREARDLSDLIDDILVIAKSERDALVFSRVKVTLIAQAAQVIEGLGVADVVEVVEQAEAPALAIADPQRVRQIIRNLVTNAIKYGGDDVRLEIYSDGPTTGLIVSDDGGGVPLADVDQIFEPYRRAHSAPGVTGSMGLGLAVSRHLADAMGGGVTYEREIDRSVFTMTLPSLQAGSERLDVLNHAGSRSS